MAKLEITIDVIIHATEDVKKFLEVLEDVFGLDESNIDLSNVVGHYDNPITRLQVKLNKKPGKEFLEKFLELLSENQKNEIIQEIEERTEKSTLHIRFDKQDFIKRKISFKEKEAIRLKIHTPVYNKKETVKVFREILQVN